MLFSPLISYFAIVSISCLVSSAFATRCSHPTERKEWRALSRTERTEWIAAIKCLTRINHDSTLAPSVNPSDIPPVNTSSSYYDDIVYLHMDLNHKIHSTGFFLPWHRWYIHGLETALRSKCHLKGPLPYWDWTQDAADVYNSDFFKDSDPHSGLGGWGSPAPGTGRDFAVADGAFSHSAYRASYPSPHPIRRNFTLQPYLNTFNAILITDPSKYANTSFTPAEKERLTHGFVGNYTGFQTYFEAPEGAHNSVHLIVNGDLAGQCPPNADPSCISGPTWSPNDPLFWLHHTMVDKVWADWQKQHPVNRYAFEGGSIQRLDSLAEYYQYPVGAPPNLDLDSLIPADGLFPAAKVRDVIDTTGGILCYKYV